MKKSVLNSRYKEHNSGYFLTIREKNIWDKGSVIILLKFFQMYSLIFNLNKMMLSLIFST